MERIPILILKMGDSLLVTIQVDMHDRLAMTLQEDLTERIVSARAHGVLIDISALEIVDSFIGRMLANIAAMARVLDAKTVVVGMRPAVAITLVELGPPGRQHGAQRREGHGAHPPGAGRGGEAQWASSGMRPGRSVAPRMSSASARWCANGPSPSGSAWSTRPRS